MAKKVFNSASEQAKLEKKFANREKLRKAAPALIGGAIGAVLGAASTKRWTGPVKSAGGRAVLGGATGAMIGKAFGETRKTGSVSARKENFMQKQASKKKYR